jgi:hypothetical protein
MTRERAASSRPSLPAVTRCQLLASGGVCYRSGYVRVRERLVDRLDGRRGQVVRTRWDVSSVLWPPPNQSRPADIQMEPTRQTVCAIMVLRRAAHLKR